MNQSAVAYFLAGPEREYIVLGDRAMKDPHAAIHEYLHVIVRHSGLKLPLWLNEGWAEVFSSLRPMGKEMAVGDLLPDRVKTLGFARSGSTSTRWCRWTGPQRFTTRIRARGYSTRRAGRWFTCCFFRPIIRTISARL